MEREIGPGPVLRMKPRANVGEADAHAPFVLQASSGIGDLYPRSRSFGARADPNAATLRQGRESVDDAVLDQRHDHHRRNFRRLHFLRHVDFDRKSRSHANLLNVEVGHRKRYLAPERGARLAQNGQRRGEVAGQVQQHRFAGDGVGLVQPANAGERVEQEVRLDLRLHDGDPRLGVFAVDLLAVVRLTLQRRGGVGAALQVERECRGHGGQHQVCARETRQRNAAIQKLSLAKARRGTGLSKSNRITQPKSATPTAAPSTFAAASHTNNRHPSRGPRLATITTAKKVGVNRSQVRR